MTDRILLTLMQFSSKTHVIAHLSKMRENPTSTGICVSAPGKVLLTGGYLVLWEQYGGLVLALSARFHASICRSPLSSIESEEFSRGSERIVDFLVECPQLHQTIRAAMTLQEHEKLLLTIDEGSDCNAYVTETIQIACNCISGLISLPLFAKNLKEIKSSSQKVLIRLEADNDFYSQVTWLRKAQLSLRRSSLMSLPQRCSPLPDHDSASDISKTGLGSSAALVTSLVGALVAFFIPNWQNLENHCDALNVVHNLAQFCHSAIQRKIGSGFDISAACYGSQRYRRFPPQLLANICSQDDLRPRDLASCVKNQSIWKLKMRVESFELPPGFCCLLGDVDGGTSTVSMVQQVLAWAKENPKISLQTFDMIHSRNQQVEDTLIQLTTLLKKHPESNLVRRKLATKTSEMWPTIDPTLGVMCSEIRQSFLHVRQSLRELGRLAQALIEPPEQTALIDETMKVPGVLFAGVPGAGGYDAIFVIAMDESVLTHVENFWEVWSANHSSMFAVHNSSLLWEY